MPKTSELTGAFAAALGKLEGAVKKLDVAAANTRHMYALGSAELTYAAALRCAVAAEQAALLARALPAFTGSPFASMDVETITAANVPVEIGFTTEGWFSVRLPLLLPKKERGSAEYVRSILLPALRAFYAGRPPIRFDGCVLIYRHVYAEDRPERQRRDHDNIEINMVSDCVALYAMTDDAPGRCSHYYCSAAAATERTEVYIVPESEFAVWLEAEKTMPDEGVKLYEIKPGRGKKLCENGSEEQLQNPACRYLGKTRSPRGFHGSNPGHIPTKRAVTLSGNSAPGEAQC